MAQDRGLAGEVAEVGHCPAFAAPPLPNESVQYLIAPCLMSGERAAKPHVPGRTLPLLPPSSAWHYIDPEGKEQGPFDAKKLVNWVDLGYFGQGDLQVKLFLQSILQ